MRRRFRRGRAGMVGGAVLLGALALWRLANPLPNPRDAVATPEGRYRVERVVDGDTLRIVGPPLQTNGGASSSVTLRLIGVDTPETVKPNHPVEPWGREASGFTRSFVAGGVVRLQLDRERLDSYGRTLAYVWVDDKLLNEELLRAGLATYEPQYRYAEPMKRRFRKAQNEAREQRRGMWGTQ